YNGGEPRPGWFRCRLDDAWQETEGTRFLSLGDGGENDLEAGRRNLRGAYLPERLVPVGWADEDVVLLSVSGADRGTIYFWALVEAGFDGSHFGVAAESFTEFLAGLHYHPSTQPWMELLDADNLEGVRRWLDDGGDPNVEDELAQTPVEYAAGEGKGEAVTLLLERGAEPRGAFTRALHAGHSGVLRAILASGMGGEDAREVFVTADWGALLQDQELLDRLLAAGTDVNHRGMLGVTPLHAAASGGNSEAVRWLLAHGAQPGKWDDTG